MVFCLPASRANNVAADTTIRLNNTAVTNKKAIPIRGSLYRCVCLDIRLLHWQGAGENAAVVELTVHPNTAVVQFQNGAGNK